MLWLVVVACLTVVHLRKFYKPAEFVNIYDYSSDIFLTR